MTKKFHHRGQREELWSDRPVYYLTKRSHEQNLGSTSGQTGLLCNNFLEIHALLTALSIHPKPPPPPPLSLHQSNFLWQNSAQIYIFYILLREITISWSAKTKFERENAGSSSTSPATKPSRIIQRISAKKAYNARGEWDCIEGRGLRSA